MVAGHRVSPAPRTRRAEATPSRAGCPPRLCSRCAAAPWLAVPQDRLGPEQLFRGLLGHSPQPRVLAAPANALCAKVVERAANEAGPEIAFDETAATRTAGSPRGARGAGVRQGQCDGCCSTAAPTAVRDQSIIVALRRRSDASYARRRRRALLLAIALQQTSPVARTASAQSAATACRPSPTTFACCRPTTPTSARRSTTCSPKLEVLI